MNVLSKCVTLVTGLLFQGAAWMEYFKRQGSLHIWSKAKETNAPDTYFSNSKFHQLDHFGINTYMIDFLLQAIFHVLQESTE